MASDQRELAETEKLVLAGAEAIARLKARMAAIDRVGRKHAPDMGTLQTLEAQQRELIEKRNALFRQVAGNDY